MKELIKIQTEGERQVVSARELHEFLGSKRIFGNWISKRIEQYGFVEGEDFITNLLKSTGGRPSKEYALSLDMAKELCMVENNEKGRQARRYFIEMERKAHYLTPAPMSRKQLAQMVLDAEEQLEAQQKQIETLSPKAQLMDRVLDSDHLVDVGQVAKILELGMGRNTLFRQLRERGVFFHNRNEPKQYYIDRGYFKLKERYIERTHHDGFVVMKVLVTQKGLAFVADLFGITQKPRKQLSIE